MSTSNLIVSDTEQRIIRKITWRIVPFLTLLYLIAFLDRINIGFAAITMNHDVGLTSKMFGLGAGIFFFGYFIFEVPSTVILQKVGARYWISRVMITWGLASIGMIFTKGPLSFYILRFLLGVAEAGFFPGVILYIGYWFPAKQRSAVIAIFMAASPIAGMIGSPISGALMQLHGALGLKGWQWLFLMEGLPAVVFGFVTFWFLTDRPADAKWLNEGERRTLTELLDRESAATSKDKIHGMWRAMADWKVLTLALAYFGTSAGLYTVGIWAPLIIHQFGFRLVTVGFLVAIPNFLAIIGMLIWSWNSDRTGERYFHAAIACLIAAFGLALTAKADGSIVIAIIGLSAAAFGVSAAKPPLWTLPTVFFAGSGAAVSIGLINSLGTLGGFVGPYLIGSSKQANGNFSRGLYFVGGSLVISAITIAVLRFVVHRNPRHN